MHVRGWFLGAAITLAPIVMVRPAFAQATVTAADRARARANFQEGVAAYQRGDFAVALAAFQTAYRIAPHPSVRVNLANCYMQLHQPVEALENFEAFLSESTNIPPAQREEVQRQVEEMRRQIAEVQIRVEPVSATDAIVTLDGHAVSTASPVRLAPGHHVVEVIASGFPPRRMDLDATQGMHNDFVVDLRPTGTANAAVASTATTSTTTTGTATASTETPTSPSTTPEASPPPQTTTSTAAAAPATTAPPTEATPPAETRHGWSPLIFYAGVGVTAVALIGWAGFGIGALAENSTFNDAVAQVHAGNDVANQMARGQDAANNARTFANVSDVFLAPTIVAAGATVFIFTRTDFHPPATVSPVVGSGQTGLVVQGRF